MLDNYIFLLNVLYKMSSIVYKVAETFYKNFQINKFDEVEGIFSGVLVKYGNRDRQGDIILPNACDKSIKDWQNLVRKIPALYEHNTNLIISENIVNIEGEDDEVEIEIRVSDAFKINHATEFNSMIEAYRNGMAFFSVGINGAKSIYHKVDKTDNNIYIRYIFQEVYIVEGSFTTNPANPMAKIDFMKSMEEIDTLIKSISSFSKAEEFLRKNTDFTQGQCNTIIKNILAINKNSSPAQDCQSNQPVQVQKTAIEEVFGL